MQILVTLFANRAIILYLIPSPGEREQNYPKASGESEVMPGLRKAYLGTMCFVAMARLFVLKAMLKQGI